MIFHSIRFKLKPDVTPEQLDPVLKQLHKMGREIPSIVTYCVGRDIGGEFDYGATFVTRDIDGYQEYMHSPIHRKVDDLGLPLVDNMVSYDVTDDEDPDIAERIGSIHKQRFEGDPELSQLVGGLSSYSGSGRAD
jgi:hypothetical protein